ncbi:hypothetical protein EAH79_02180 [Sphingomonas koreensis]|nr:hypothetical protein EAH79_02180 [Sphingomonas koreensis]
MTVLDDVARLITRLAPEAVCDDCIADRLGLEGPQHANHQARELAGSNGYERKKDVCALCGTAKLVIRRHPAP